MNKKIYYVALIVSIFLQLSVFAQMKIGTNLGFRADWTKELPWKTGVDFEECWNSGKTNGVVNNSPWNPTFLEDQKPFSVIRFMNWNHTNGSQDTTWAERRLPSEKIQDAFSGGSKDDYKGVAYEWMIDLVNRLNSDIWLNIPHSADDNYIKQLATLVKDNLNPGLKCYIEHSNEVWNNNLSKQYNYCIARGKELNLGGASDYEIGQKYHVYRSVQIWTLWVEVFGNEMDKRVVKVLAGKSTDPGNAVYTLYPALLNTSINPSGIMPDAYGIAPYFGGNGLDGSTTGIFDLLRKDIFLHRALSPDISSRMDNVKEIFNFLKGKNIDLIAYEGGQHLATKAVTPNRDPQMYSVYIEYLEALDDYMPLFTHYITVNSFSEDNCFGAKEYTGQPMSEAHKYRALYDYIKVNDNRFKKLDVLNGTGSDYYMPGTQVEITADQPDNGKTFHKWVGDISVLSNYLNPNTTLIMPDSAIAIAAVYENKVNVTPVNVINGIGSGKYKAGNYIQVTANEAPQGKMFSKWIGDTEHMFDTTAFSTALLVSSDSISIEAVFIDDTVTNTYRFLRFTVSSFIVSTKDIRIKELQWKYKGVNYPQNALVGIDTLRVVANSGVQNSNYLYDLSTATAFVIFPALSLPLSVTLDMKTQPIMPDGISFFLPSDKERGPSKFICEGSNDSVNYSIIYEKSDLKADNYLPNTYNTFNFEPKVPEKYNLSVTGGGGSGSYIKNSNITVFALEIAGKQFHHWSGDVSYLKDVNSAVTNLTMPNQIVNIEAVYTDIMVPKYSLKVNFGSGSGSYSEETLIKIEALDSLHYIFNSWSGDISYLSKSTNKTSWIVMPSVPVILTANYIAEPKYSLTVNLGKGSGSYYEGDTIAIQANDSTEKYAFASWSGDVNYLMDKNNKTTKVIMPSKNVSIKAEYILLSSHLNQVEKIVKVYPVPAKEILYIIGYDKQVPYKIIDLQGKIVQVGIYEGNSIEISRLNSGIYVLMINEPQTNKYFFLKE